MSARGISPATASELLSNANERALWYRIFKTDDDAVLLKAMMFLMTMRDGKPAQSINVTSQSLVVNADVSTNARAIANEIVARLTSQHDTNRSQGDTSPLTADARSPECVTNDDKLLTDGARMTESDTSQGDTIVSGHDTPTLPDKADGQHKAEAGEGGKRVVE